MRIAHSLFVSCLLLTGYAHGQAIDPEVANDPVRKPPGGHVLTIRQTVILYDGENVNPVHMDYNATLYYSENNSLTTRTYYDAYGSLKTESYFYDTTGRFLQKIVVTNAAGEEEENTRFEFNERGELMSRKFESGASSNGHQNSFEYRDGKMTKQLLAYAGAESSIIFSYRYDNHGNRVEQTEEIPQLLSGKAGYNRKAYSYNKQNVPVKEQEYDAKDKLICTRTFTYDTRNRLVKATTAHTVSGPYDNVKTYRYDKDGNLTECITDYTDDRLDERTSFRYVFDSHKNLVHKLIYRDGTLVFELKRDITYP